VLLIAHGRACRPIRLRSSTRAGRPSLPCSGSGLNLPADGVMPEAVNRLITGQKTKPTLARPASRA